MRVDEPTLIHYWHIILHLVLGFDWTIYQHQTSNVRCPCRPKWGWLQMAVRVVTDGIEGRWVHMIEHRTSGVRSSIYVYSVSMSPDNLLRDPEGEGCPDHLMHVLHVPLETQRVSTVNLLHAIHAPSETQRVSTVNLLHAIHAPSETQRVSTVNLLHAIHAPSETQGVSTVNLYNTQRQRWLTLTASYMYYTHPQIDRCYPYRQPLIMYCMHHYRPRGYRMAEW